jgi:methyl-accepting chemotaxis protein
MKKPKRSKMFVDHQVQGRLLRRVVAYWCMALVVMGGLAFVQILFESRQAPLPIVLNRTLLAFGPALIAGIVVLPLILIDAMRFSNKFAGPIHRFRREMKRLADGESYDTITFRPGDFWSELATEFNRLAERLEKLEQSGGHAVSRQTDREETFEPAGSL